MNILRKIMNYFFPIKEEKDVVKFALKVVEATQPKEWRVGGAIKVNGQCCFLGHMAIACGMKDDVYTTAILNNDRIGELDMKIINFVKKKHNYDINHSYQINDRNDVNGYTEDHPRDRMLHVLRDMLKEK